MDANIAFSLLQDEQAEQASSGGTHPVLSPVSDKFAKQGGKPKYHLSDMVSQISIGYEEFTVILDYMYSGKLTASPMEVSTCVYNVCTHDACRPPIDYAVELMYSCATFQMKELVATVKRHLFSFVEKTLVEDVIPIRLTAFHCQLTDLFSLFIQRVVQSDLDKVSLEKELPDQVSTEIISLRKKLLQEIEPTWMKVDPLHERRIGRIHKALDSDDIELVKLLVDESNVTLDGALLSTVLLLIVILKS
uniref:C2HC NPR-type domain-containing protein n=1 Tax=Kalanchoe fedtschenkoi TaxID=63787 RepID=A0A7N0T2N0_KALFE